jgi:tetratricopeptide (TPR) repeat protein
MIDKRNAWQARSVLYVRLIPPGAADVAHYRVKVPKDAKGPLQFTAKLNYRKFSHYYTQFAYAGRPKPNQDPKLLSASFNSMAYSFDPHDIPQDVSGNIKGRIPDLPVTTVASAKASVPLGPSAWTPVVRKEDRERWNDWGIGLLLQGDLKGAEYAFEKVTEAEPGYADGWLNVARALIQEGETEAAKPYVEQALKIDPKLGRIYFFKAMIQKAAGNVSARPRRAEPSGAYSISATQICRSSQVSRPRLRCGPGGSANALYPHAVSPRLGRRIGRRARTGALPTLQGGGVRAGDHRQAAPAQPGE